MTTYAVPISTAGTKLSVGSDFRATLFQAEQGGQDGIWMSNRYPFITSTITGSILNPNAKERTWFERMKLADREEIDDLSKARMSRGSELEDVARMYFEKMHHVRVYERGLWISADRPHTAVSPDGFVLESTDMLWNPGNKMCVTSPAEIPTKTLVEIKCPSSSPKQQQNGSMIYDSYITQVMDAMDKLDCLSCYFVILETEQGMDKIRSLLPSSGPSMPLPGKLHVFQVHRSQAFIDAMKLAVDYFTSCLELQVEPVKEIPFTDEHYRRLLREVQIDTVFQKDVPRFIHEEVMHALGKGGERMDIDE